MDRKMAGKRKPPRNESRPQNRTAGKDRPPKAAQAGGGRERQGFSRRGEKEAFAPKRLAEGRMLLYGFHAVREALRAGRRQIFEVQATPAAAERLTGELASASIVPKLVDNETIAARLPPGAVHQGLVAEVSPAPAPGIEDLPPAGLVLVLDQITDPHNVGAIIRTAAAFAVDAIITTERHSPALEGILAKTASGGLEHVPVISVVNLARAMEKLEDQGYLRIGLDSDGAMSLEAMDLHRPLALVLGAEGKGLRRLTRENCTMVARLDMPGAIRSLNVSNACAVALAIAHVKLSAQS